MERFVCASQNLIESSNLCLILERGLLIFIGSPMHCWWAIEQFGFTFGSSVWYISDKKLDKTGLPFNGHLVALYGINWGEGEEGKSQFQNQLTALYQADSPEASHFMGLGKWIMLVSPQIKTEALALLLACIWREDLHH